MDCLFCKIAAGEIPSQKVYESEHAFAFLDIHPLTDGHTVVVSKVHVADLTALPEAEVGPFFEALRKIVSLLKTKLGADNFTIGMNHGEAAGQAVPHFHVHVVPRCPGDGGGSIHSIMQSNQKESLESVHKKITSS